MSDKKSDGDNRLDQRSVRQAQRNQAQIGSGLRRMFDDVIDEGVPDAFEDLLDQLEKAEAKSKRDSGEAEKADKR